MQNTVVDTVLWVDGAYDDVVVGVGESEGLRLEGENEGEGFGFGFEGGELDATIASGFPVLALGEDIDGED